MKKIIIDIPEAEYDNVLKFTDCYAFGYAIANGKPLQTELEEISREINSLNHHYDERSRYCLVANDVFKILDNHIKELNNET